MSCFWDTAAGIILIYNCSIKFNENVDFFDEKKFGRNFKYYREKKTDLRSILWEEKILKKNFVG